jgi:single stranded DNA-binding protein
VLASLNRVTITGYLVCDPTLRSTPSRKSVGTMRIACHRRNQAQPGGTWAQWVDYCDARIYGPFAHFACQQLRAGSGVAIEGRLRSRPIDCENPEHRVGMFVVVRKIQLLAPALDVSPALDASPRSGAPLGIDAPLDAPLAPKRRARFSYGSIDAS